MVIRFNPDGGDTFYSKHEKTEGDTIPNAGKSFNFSEALKKYRNVEINNPSSIDISQTIKSLKKLKESGRMNESTINETIIKEMKAEDEKKYEPIEKKKNTVKASNGMTYNQIMSRLLDFTHRNWGGVIIDPKTGKARLPKLSEIVEKLRSLAQSQGGMYADMLAEVESLISAKKELEQEHPEFKDVKYTPVRDEKGNIVSYLPGSITSDIDV